MTSGNKTAEKYTRASRVYDAMESPIERMVFQRLRRLQISQIEGKTLEIGVGTGKNLPFYDKSTDLTAIDFSVGMLKKAEERLSTLSMDHVELLEMDVQDLGFEDNTFDSAISTFVFCTVPDPIKGLKEVLRVLKPEGKAIFLEHMKSRHFLINIMLMLMNIITKPLLGTSMTRETQRNIELAGFKIEAVTYGRKHSDVIRMIVARKEAL